MVRLSDVQRTPSRIPELLSPFSAAQFHGGHGHVPYLPGSSRNHGGGGVHLACQETGVFCPNKVTGFL